MTASYANATSKTAGKMTNCHSLQGKLRLMSETRHCSKRNKTTTKSAVVFTANSSPKTNGGDVRKRSYASARDGMGLVGIRNASKRRSDRLKIVSVTAVVDKKSKAHGHGEGNIGKASADASAAGATTKTTPTPKNEGGEGSSSSAAPPSQAAPLSRGESKKETPPSSDAAKNGGGGGPGRSNTPGDPENPRDARGSNGPAHTTTTTTTTMLLHPLDVKEYEEAEERQKEALRRIEGARQQVYKDQVHQVWGLYTYGLKHVLGIKDLSDAPDAIMKTM